MQLHDERSGGLDGVGFVDAVDDDVGAERLVPTGADRVGTRERRLGSHPGASGRDVAAALQIDRRAVVAEALATDVGGTNTAEVADECVAVLECADRCNQFDVVGIDRLGRQCIHDRLGRTRGESSGAGRELSTPAVAQGKAHGGRDHGRGHPHRHEAGEPPTLHACFALCCHDVATIDPGRAGTELGPAAAHGPVHVAVGPVERHPVGLRPTSGSESGPTGI